jgi:hypothetical protein
MTFLNYTCKFLDGNVWRKDPTVCYVSSISEDRRFFNVNTTILTTLTVEINKDEPLTLPRTRSQPAEDDDEQCGTSFAPIAITLIFGVCSIAIVILLGFCDRVEKKNYKKGKTWSPVAIDEHGAEIMNIPPRPKTLC